MSQKKITFIVTADTKNADASFAKLEAEAKKLGMALDGGGTKKPGSVAGATGQASFALTNMGRVATDLPFGFIAIQNNLDPLIQSFITLKNETGGVKGALISLKNSMMGAGGLFLAFQIVTSAITMFMMSNRGAKKEVKEVTNELEKFKSQLKDLNELYVGENQFTFLTALDNALRALGKSAGFAVDALAEYYKKQAQIFGGTDKKILEVVEQATKGGTLTIFTKGELTDALSALGKAQEGMKSGTYQLQENLKAMRNIREELEKFDPKKIKIFLKWQELIGIKPLPVMDAFGPQDVRRQMNYVPVPEKPEIPGLTEKELREKFVLFSEISDAAAQTMRQNFSQAWNDIFGEANSLFEQFIQNIASGLLSLAANQVSGGIFDFLVGSGMFGKPSTIILEVDGERFGTYVDRRVPNAINRAKRLRAM